MKAILQLLTAGVLALALSSCLFQEPVYTDGFVKPDASLAGVWVAEDDSGDPRGREFAVLVPSGEDALTLHYPVGYKGSSYFEIRPVKSAAGDLWQAKLTATFEDGLPKKDTPVYTLLLVEKAGEGKLKVRTLNNEGEHTASAAATRKALDGKPDLNKLFGEAKTFTRLKDR